MAWAGAARTGCPHPACGHHFVTSGSDASPAINLINGSGLSGTPTLANLGTHSTNDGDNLWATTASGSDYFASQPPVVLTCTLPRSLLVSGLVYWGYGGSYSEAKSFTVEFSTDGINFSGAVNVTRSMLAVVSGVRLAFSGLARTATHVRVTITDNHYGTGGFTGEGDRVGLGEIRFAGQPYPSVILSNLGNTANSQVQTSEGQFAQAFDTGSTPARLDNLTIGWRITPAPAGHACSSGAARRPARCQSRSWRNSAPPAISPARPIWTTPSLP